MKKLGRPRKEEKHSGIIRTFWCNDCFAQYRIRFNHKCSQMKECVECHFSVFKTETWLGTGHKPTCSRATARDKMSYQEIEAMTKETESVNFIGMESR